MAEDTKPATKPEKPQPVAKDHFGPAAIVNHTKPKPAPARPAQPPQEAK